MRLVSNIWLFLRRRYRRIVGFSHKPFEIALKDLAENLWLKHNRTMKAPTPSIAVQELDVSQPVLSSVMMKPETQQLELLPTPSCIESSSPPSESESVVHRSVRNRPSSVILSHPMRQSSSSRA